MHRPDFEIKDGHGSDRKLKIYDEGAVGVVVHDHPPFDEGIPSYPFSQWMTSDGDATGSNNMLVDGSTNSQLFYISAKSDVDIYIKTLSIRVADGSAVLNKFGNLAALPNGCDLIFFNNDLGEVVIQDEMKTNLDIVRVGLSTPTIGSGSTAFRADTSGAGTDTYLPFIDLSQTFGFPWGLRLKKGTNDRIGFSINDDVSAMDGFDIKGFGIQL